MWNKEYCLKLAAYHDELADGLEREGSTGTAQWCRDWAQWYRDRAEGKPGEEVLPTPGR